MNYNRYSQEWRDKLSLYLDAIQVRTWEDAVQYFRFYDEQRVKDENLVILSEGVWMEISRLFNDGWHFEKVRCITEHDVYFDGSDFTGSIAMGSLDHIFKIDGHELDIRRPIYRGKTKQELLLDFINTYAGVSDNRLPPVPKGILKV